MRRPVCERRRRVPFGVSGQVWLVALESMSSTLAVLAYEGAAALTDESINTVSRARLVLGDGAEGLSTVLARGHGVRSIRPA